MAIIEPQVIWSAQRNRQTRKGGAMHRLATGLLLRVFVAGMACGSDDPQDLNGYGKSVWGMTTEEVIKAEAPRAERLEKPSKFKTGLGLVSIKNISIGVNPFVATYIFDESGQK